jgi:hypothetical protein
MATAGTTLVTTAITVGLAGAIGYGLYKVITVKGEATIASDYGRKWLAWMVVVVSIAILPRFFRRFDADSLVTWVIDVVFYGAVAFVAGWLYGKVFRVKLPVEQDNSNSKSATAHETTATSESIENRLEALKILRDKGVINQEEYETKRKDILGSL